jgi:hypothetical protein
VVVPEARCRMDEFSKKLRSLRARIPALIHMPFVNERTDTCEENLGGLVREGEGSHAPIRMLPPRLPPYERQNLIALFNRAHRRNLSLSTLRSSSATWHPLQLP